MAEIAAGAAIVGAGVQAYGAIKSAGDQSEIDQEKSAAQNAQANEIHEREAINDSLRASRAFQAKLDFAAAAAGSGHAGAGVGSQLEIQRQSDLQTKLSDEDAAFQEAMLRKGAGLDAKLAEDTKSAGYWSAAGSILGGAGKVLAPSSGILGRTVATQALPAVPEGY